MALAASVALLIAGSALLSDVLTPPTRPEVTPLHKAQRPKGLPPADDDGGEDVVIESLDQIGNNPTAIHIKVFRNK
jgi:hypothetical protein